MRLKPGGAGITRADSPTSVMPMSMRSCVLTLLITASLILLHYKNIGLIIFMIAAFGSALLFHKMGNNSF